MTAGEIARRCGGEKERAGYWTARCPAHDDAKASLSLKDGRDGVLWKCHAGCTVDAVCGALGLKQSDLFEKSERTQVAALRKRAAGNSPPCSGFPGAFWTACAGCPYWCCSISSARKPKGLTWRLRNCASVPCVCCALPSYLRAQWN